MCNEDPVEAVKRIANGKGMQCVLECSGAPNALNEVNPPREGGQDGERTD